MTTNLYLIRHGESVPNVEPIIGGPRGDTGLTARGRAQAAALEARLAASDLRPDHLYTSTLPRTIETAEYVSRALGLPAVPEDDWHELRPGAADGLSHEAWFARHGGPDGRDFDANPYQPFAPGGESWATFLLRVGAQINRTVRRHYYQTVVVVCHGGVLEASFYHAFGLGPTGNRVRFIPLNTSITHWRHGPGRHDDRRGWTLVTFNDAAHLHDLDASEQPRPAVQTPVSDDND